MLQKVCQSVHFRFQIGHVGPILAPSWRSWAPSSPILPPRWVPRGIQKGGKKAFVLQPPAKPPKDPQEAPKMPPNSTINAAKCSKIDPKMYQKSNALQSLSDPTYSSTVSVYLLISTWIDLVSSFGAFRSLAVQVYLYIQAASQHPPPCLS